MGLLIFITILSSLFSICFYERIWYISGQNVSVCSASIAVKKVIASVLAVGHVADLSCLISELSFGFTLFNYLLILPTLIIIIFIAFFSLTHS
jgi:hypothetical protein